MGEKIGVRVKNVGTANADRRRGRRWRVKTGFLGMATAFHEFRAVLRTKTEDGRRHGRALDWDIPRRVAHQHGSLPLLETVGESLDDAIGCNPHQSGDLLAVGLWCKIPSG